MSGQELDLALLKSFLGEERIKGEMYSDHLVRFKERFLDFFNTIQTAKTKKDNEATIEEAIRELMANIIRNHHSKFDSTKKNNYDIVVRNQDGQVVTLLECKKVQAKEMSSTDNLNNKALQQLIYYFLKETVKDVKTKPLFTPSLSIKNLMISDGFTWLIWRNTDFYSLVTESFFYDGVKTNLAKIHSVIKKSGDNYPIIEEYINQIGIDKFKSTCYALDLHALKSVDDLDEQDWNILYHFFSAPVWLGHSAYLDPNSLNKAFYYELLYIMGLKEVPMSNTANSDNEGMMIIVPEPESINSFYDQVRRKRGLPSNEIMDESILGNIIPWINRVLFLKLLEAHIISARVNPEEQKEERLHFAFMEYGSVINHWSDLYTLFFEVLAVEYEKRERVPSYFEHVPYLNSSLFTLNKEKEIIEIDRLYPSDRIPLYRDSVLAHEDVAEMPLLEYLLKFLSRYAFNTNGKSNVSSVEDRLINASVLGKVFEKLNGYKDGSFYTPSFITTYICKESIQQSLIGRVNEELGLEESLTSYEQLTDLFDGWLDRGSKNVEKVQAIVRDLTIIDPSVGSGHFLVSALNEMMQLRYDFNMLGKMGAKLEVVNDELMMRDRQSHDIMRYNIYHESTQRMQEEIFQAKQEIIENNLFGVDINSNSVEICRLRLWIELLKHSYYIISEKDKSQKLKILKESKGYVAMETLPNIDINIKVGNSLLYSLPLNDKIDDLMRNELFEHLQAYNHAVQAYKHVRNKQERQELESTINDLYYNVIPSTLILNEQAKGEELGTEWRYLFPESLDKESGAFVGFDVVVGNPPYIQLQSMNEAIKAKYQGMKYKTFVKTGDIYMLFYELGIQLLHGKSWGQMGMVTSNKWMLANYGEKLRQHLMEKIKINTLIDFNDSQFFEKATTYPNILMVSHNKRIDPVYYSFDQRWVPADKDNNLYELLENYEPKNLMPSKERFLLKTLTEYAIFQKAQTIGKPLGEWDVTINRGVITGLNEAFYLSTEQKDALIAQDAKSAEIIVPMLRGREIMPYHQHVQHNEWLIATLATRNIDIEDYPAVKQHMMQWYDKLQQTGERGARSKSGYQWFETQRPANYWQDFAKKKVIFSNLSKYTPFAYDEEKFYINQNAYIATSSRTETLKYLTGLLNSHLYFYLWDFYLPKSRGNSYQLSKVFMVQVPILEPSPEQEAHVISLVDAIIAAKQAGTSSVALEQELDDYIFSLYELTDEQIAIIKAVEKPTKDK